MMDEYVALKRGALVHRDVLGVVDEIRRIFGDSLKVQYIDPKHARPNEKPYRIMEIDDRGKWHVVFDTDTLDDRVIVQLYEIDKKRGHDALAELVKKETAELMAAAKLEEEWNKEEAEPLMARAVKDTRAFTFKNDRGDLVKLEGDGTIKKVKRGNEG